MLRFKILGIILLVAAVGLPVQVTGNDGCLNVLKRSNAKIPDDKLIRKINDRLSRLPEGSTLTKQLKIISSIASKAHDNGLAKLIKHDMNPAICNVGILERVEKALGMVNAGGDHVSIATSPLVNTLVEYKKREEQVCRDHPQMIAVNKLKQLGLLPETYLGPYSQEPGALLSPESPLNCNQAYYESVQEAGRSIATIAKDDKRRAWWLESELTDRVCGAVSECFEQAFEALGADDGALMERLTSGRVRLTSRLLFQIVANSDEPDDVPERRLAKEYLLSGQSIWALTSEQVAGLLKKFQVPCEALLEFEEGAGVLKPITEMTRLLKGERLRLFVDDYGGFYRVPEIVVWAARWKACRWLVDSSKN